MPHKISGTGIPDTKTVPLNHHIPLQDLHSVNTQRITQERPIYPPLEAHAGCSLANRTSSSVREAYSQRHADKTVLQQHCLFWDRDGDGVVWPQDTYIGFRELGFNIVLSIAAIFIIHFGFSYPSTLYHSWFPDPLFRVFLNGIHKCKHGGDTGTYDNEGRFVPQNYYNIYSKYDKDMKGGLTIREVFDLHKGQRVAMDPFGWFAMVFEWWTTVILTYDTKLGMCSFEDVRGVFDGSYFFQVAEYRRKHGHSPKGLGLKEAWYLLMGQTGQSRRPFFPKDHASTEIAHSH